MAKRVLTPAQKASRAIYMRSWREKNPEQWAGIAKAARKKWKANNRDEHREAQRVHRYTVRKEILDLLGGPRCIHCGYDKDVRALCIDHIHSDGRTDQRSLNGSTNLWAFRNYLKDAANNAEARKKYQILCFNCNHLKMHDKKEFGGQAEPIPHELNKRRAWLYKAKARGVT